MRKIGDKEQSMEKNHTFDCWWVKVVIFAAEETRALEEEDEECKRKLQVMEQCMKHALLKYLT